MSSPKSLPFMDQFAAGAYPVVVVVACRRGNRNC